MAEQFDIVRWLKAEIRFNVPLDTLRNKVLGRGLQDVTDYADLTERDKELLKADAIEWILTGPSTTASKSWSHGDMTRSVGSEVMTYRDKLYEYMISIYRRWNDPKAETNDAMGGYVQWVD